MAESNVAIFNERTEPVAELSIESANTLLQDELSNPVIKVTPIARGNLNENYIISSGGNKYVLRIHKRDTSNCALEAAIYDKICEEVPIPELIATHSDSKGAWALWEYIDATPLDLLKNQSDPKLWHCVGTALASIHSFTFDEAGLLGSDLHVIYPFARGSSPYYVETRRLIHDSTLVRKRLGGELTPKVAAFVDQHRDFFPVMGATAALVHSDFRPDNILVTDDGDVFVVDWEFSHAGSPVLDFAVLLRHQAVCPVDIDALTQGYEEAGGYLGEEWRQQAQVSDLVNILQLLDRDANRPNLYAFLIERVADIVK